jgi:hypothetical protein
MMEVQMRLLAKAIPRFIQLGGPLPPLKPMAQSPLPHELSKLPHDVIEPSALRAAKALSLE